MAHETRAHAVLSPSSAERWIECPASVRLAESLPSESSSSFAREGTAAHEIHEIEARYALLGMTVEDYDAAMDQWRTEWPEYVDDLPEMQRHAAAYVDLLRSRMEVYPNSILMLEQRLPTGLPDDGKGTSDAVIVSPEHVESVDLKYGRGVEVVAEDNPQLMLYAHGALRTYGDLLGDVTTVCVTVFQPRRNHIESWCLTPEELETWHANVSEIAEQALGDDAPFGPSEAACRWCPASGQCRAQMEAVFAEDFTDEPETLTGEELAAVLPRLPMLSDWVKRVTEVALDRAYSQGEKIPGYKMVRSGGRRSIVDHEGALSRLALVEDLDPDDYLERKAVGIGKLQRLLGDDFEDVVGEFVRKSEGSLSLVPESDKRREVSPESEAAADFAD